MMTAGEKTHMALSVETDRYKASMLKSETALEILQVSLGGQSLAIHRPTPHNKPEFKKICLVWMFSPFCLIQQ